ncbi:hypothetical protein D3C86_1975220 [compost metagenome]
MRHAGHDDAAPVAVAATTTATAPVTTAAPSGPNQIWVSNDSGASVSVINADSLEVMATIAVGQGHHKMAFAGTKAYVSNITDGTVSVIDRTQLK